MTNLFRSLPDAFLLGAMRSGTTFLHAALQQHPDVAAARQKELQFFSLRWEKRLSYYRAQMPMRGPGWYYALQGKRRPVVVDATPYYLFHPEAPARLAATMGPAKCIVLLREPGARAWSHYQHVLALGWEHLGFREALAREKERCRLDLRFPERNSDMTGHALFSYIARGFYADQLRVWWHHLPRENFLLMRSEDLFRDPQRSLDRVCEFLQIRRTALADNLPRNSRNGLKMPEDIREYLNHLYEEPNQELFSLTGITWERQAEA